MQAGIRESATNNVCIQQFSFLGERPGGRFYRASLGDRGTISMGARAHLWSKVIVREVCLF